MRLRPASWLAPGVALALGCGEPKLKLGDACDGGLSPDPHDACASAGGTCVPYARLLDGGLSCVRISYCTANPNVPGPTISVCCPAPIADGGAD